MERRSSLEHNPNSIALKGNEYMLVFTASHSFWNREVSHGYGNAYVREARYQELRGSGIIIGPNDLQLDIELRGGAHEEGRPFGAINTLEEAFPFGTIDKEDYADFVATKILEEIEVLSNNDVDYLIRSRSFVELSESGSVALDLQKFSRLHREEHLKELIELGKIAEHGGQIRFPLALVENQ